MKRVVVGSTLLVAITASHGAWAQADTGTPAHAQTAEEPATVVITADANAAGTPPETAASTLETPPGVLIQPSSDYLRLAPGRVPLIVESTGPVLTISERLVPIPGRRLSATSPPICATPCTLYIDTPTFPVVGRAHGFRTASANVTLPPTGLRVRLQTASNARFWGGVGLAGGGGSFVIAGLLFVGIGALANLAAAPYSMPGNGAFVAGAIFAGLGVAALIPGVVFLGTSHTGIESSSALPASTRINRPSVTIGPLSEGGFLTVVSGRF